MSKLTREQKIEIYAKRKCGETVISLSRQYHVELENIKYLIRLIDLHGFSVLNTGKNNYYSMDLKLQMITKVLVNNQSISSTAIEFGLPSKSLLSQWITKYKENHYVIVEKTKGRYKGDSNGTVKNQLLNKVIDTGNYKTYYERDFSTTRCNEKWAEMVSYDISTSPNFKQTLRMLEMAFKKPGNEDLNNLVLQSDKGWQYQLRDYHTSLKKGITQSMSRKGDCLDNSIIENFFGVMKKEMLYGHQHEFITLKDLEQAIEE
jgi:hypothetical protein